MSISLSLTAKHELVFTRCYDDDSTRTRDALTSHQIELNRITLRCSCADAKRTQDPTSCTSNSGAVCGASSSSLHSTAIPLSHWMLPASLSSASTYVYRITMRCSKVFITHCDGFSLSLSQRVNNMRYNKSFDRSEHTRSTPKSTSIQHPTTIAITAKTSHIRFTLYLYILLGAFKDAKEKEVRKEVSQLILCRTAHIECTDTHTLAHLQYIREWVSLHIFFIQREKKKEAESSASNIREIEGKRARETKKETRKQRILIWVTQPVLFIVLSYVLKFCSVFTTLIRFAWNHHVAALFISFFRCSLSFVVAVFSRIFPSPNSIFNFIQSSISVVVSQPAKDRAVMPCIHSFVVSQICITYAVWHKLQPCRKKLNSKFEIPAFGLHTGKY